MILYLVVVASIFAVAHSECIFDANKTLGQPTPLLLFSYGKQNPHPLKLVEPDSEKIITLKSGTDILFVCPGSHITFMGPEITAVIGKCVDKETFMVANNYYHISQIACNSWPQATEMKLGKCAKTKNKYKIGFEITELNQFLTSYEVCIDEQRLITVYTEAMLTPSAFKKQIIAVKIEKVWRSTSSYSAKGIDPESLYNVDAQTNAMATILGSQKLAHEKFTMLGLNFLSKGHLVANADFFYVSHQLSTYFYLNAAPQWQNINGGNWKIIEDSARSLAYALKTPLKMFTGTMGVATLPDVNNTQVILFLSAKPELIPVPKIYWKVLYEKNSKSGVAILTFNNPHQAPKRDELKTYCEDICYKIKWLRLEQPKDIIQGYTICCEVKEFIKIFPDLPSIEVKQILDSVERINELNRIRIRSVGV